MQRFRLWGKKEMSHNKPKEITLEEYRQIIELPIIREMWGVEQNWGEEELRDWIGGIYGVRFDFFSGSPGYVGDLYILQGDALTGHPPVQLVRDENQKLQLVSYDPDVIN